MLNLLTTTHSVLVTLSMLALVSANIGAPLSYIQNSGPTSDSISNPEAFQYAENAKSPRIAYGASSDNSDLPNIARCQAPKAAGVDALSGCPKNTFFVSQTNTAAHFKSVNAALQSLDDSDGSAPTVLIDTGVYHEKVVIKRKNPLVFLGVTGTPSNPSANGVVIWQSTFVNQNDPSDRKANCDAVTLGVGATDGGTGNTDFKAYNINFVQKQIRNGQEVTQEQLGPSAALCVLNSRASFYSCGFSSYQDTVFVGAGSQALFFRSIVKGMTDQLYGEGRLWVEKCLLLSRACGGGITAWRGKPGDSKAGVYISNSRIDKSPDAQTLRPMQGKCHLGRPWNAFAQSVYLNTYMTDIVAPEGFKTWNKQQSNFDLKTTHFYEFNSSGPGATPKQRDRSVQHLLTANQAAAYTYQRVLDSTADWIDIRILQSSSSKRASKKRHRPHTVFHTSPLHATQLSAEM